ncbi:Heterokaryon incompatibility protein 6, OR allele [Cytospora mali]|uniref:Heterokaryon incompatibility protein 6, OR allele n=1 Tax=Cytospora mali TaxID=578113 RepID=A0A194UP74_CYTMA|nr:Heterokaryon incompatibility protein 6, OR allele [Valsa mali var. pyri (nom. inval.)]
MGDAFEASLYESEDMFLGASPIASPTSLKQRGERTPTLPQGPPVDASTIYERLPLHTGEFRVFQLDPSQDPSAPVVAHLIKASLDEPPQYDALSYRWSGSHGHTINVNGAQLPVTENLFLALHSLRQTSGSLPLTLWVDSICINQASIPERNEQVPLMGQIYTQAQSVRIWLGDEEPGVDAAFKLIHDCGSIGAQEVVDRVLGDERGTRALTELLRRPYWGRMWMYQEVILAQSAVVHCGSYEVSWSHLKWLDSVMGNGRLWLKLQVDKTWVAEFRDAIMKITPFEFDKQAAQDVNAVLFPTRRLQAQDPRDKIYALLGVCHALAQRVKVDYSTPTRDVYTAFAKSQIESEKRFYTSLSSGLWDPANGEDLDLPSWVPDLRGSAGFDSRYIRGDYLNSVSADLNGAASFAFSEKDGFSILEVQGLLFDTVQTRADYAVDDEQKRKAMVDRFCLTADSKDLSVSKLRGLFQAIVFEDSKSLRDEGRMKRLILGFFEDLRRLYGSLPSLTGFLESFEDIGLHILQGDNSDPLQLFSSDELHHNRLEYVAKAGRNSRDGRDSAVFATTQGHIGMGSGRVKQGDTIAIVQGYRLPVILRKHGGFFRLVSPSYVSGLMKGEAVEASGGTSSFGPVQLV